MATVCASARPERERRACAAPPTDAYGLVCDAGCTAGVFGAAIVVLI